MNLERLEEAREWIERQLRRHGVMYGCGHCYRHPGDPCEQRLALEAAIEWLRWGPAVEAAEEVWWCRTHQTDAVGSSLDATGKNISPDGPPTPYCWYWYYLRDDHDTTRCEMVPVLVVRRRLLAEEPE